MHANEIEYATITTFMYPQCDCALVWLHPPTGTQCRGAHHGAVAKKPEQDKRVPNKIEMWVKSKPKGEENGVRPLQHIPAQPTREIGGLLQPRPCRLNYFPKARDTKG